MCFAKFISKRFVMSFIICQLAKSKTKGHVKSSQQLVNINAGSAKDKDINLDPHEQSCNSHLVFSNALNIMYKLPPFYIFIFTSFLENHFFISLQEVQPMNKLSLRWYSTKYNKF